VNTVQVRLEDLRLPPNVPAGMNFLQLGHYAYLLRATNENLDPIVVEALQDGTYRITDGRHRAIAALIAGRPHVAAVVREKD
jgi:ParB-like chromosome segregation protein Spo0J